MKVCVGFGLCRRAAYVVAVAVSCCRCAADVTSADSGTYSPPILANGDIGMLIDYRNCHFQDVPSYRTIHAVGVDFLPGIYRQARRTQDGKLAALGRFEERVLLAGGKAASPESWRHRLDTDRALSLAENVYEGGARIESTAFVAAHCPVVCVRKSFEGDIESYSFDYLFCAPGTAGGLPHGATAVFRPGEISYSFGRAGKSKGFTGTISVFCSHPDAASTVLDSGVRLTVAKPKGTVDFFVVYRDSLDDDPVDADSIRKAGRDGLLAAHCASWRDFWSRSSLDIPDRKIFSTWRTALYNLKCWSTKWSIPVGILPTHWNGAYFGFTFFGPALCSSGHIPEAVKVAKFWDSVRPFALSRAGKPSRDKYAGLHYSWQTVENGTEGASGGRWLDHYLHLSNISRECWTAWLYTNDRGLLASNAYPVVKGCARRFRSAQVYELKDGRTIIGAVCDLERLPCPARNAFLTTCGAIYCFEKAAEGSDILGIDREEAAEWRRIAAALKRDLPKNAQRYLALEGYEGTSVALLSGLMPYNVLAKDDPFQIAAVEHFEKNGLTAGNMYSVGSRICTWYAAWLAGAQAVLGDGEAAYRNLKRATASVGHFSEIFEINEPAYRSCPWCSSPQGTYVESVNSMFVQCDGDTVHVAPAVPPEWKDFSFRLRAHDDMELSVRIAAGEVSRLTVQAGPMHSGRSKRFVLPSAGGERRSVDVRLQAGVKKDVAVR